MTLEELNRMSLLSTKQKHKKTQKKNQQHAHHHGYCKPTSKHGDGRLMIWALVVATKSPEVDHDVDLFDFTGECLKFKTSNSLLNMFCVVTVDPGGTELWISVLDFPPLNTPQFPCRKIDPSSDRRIYGFRSPSQRWTVILLPRCETSLSIPSTVYISCSYFFDHFWSSHSSILEILLCYFSSHLMSNFNQSALSPEAVLLLRWWSAFCGTAHIPVCVASVLGP